MRLSRKEKLQNDTRDDGFKRMLNDVELIRKVQTIVTCNIQVDDLLDNYSDDAFDIEFIFDEELVKLPSLKLTEEYADQKHYDLITKHNGAVIDMADLYQYQHHLTSVFDDEVQSYVSWNFQTNSPEITLHNMQVSYRITNAVFQ